VSEGVVVRKGCPADLTGTYHVFLAAANDLRAQLNRSAVDDTPARFERAVAFRRHALAHDPEGFWIAEADGHMIGFGIATLREKLWYLAALHVLPVYQGQGVGRELLRRCLSTGSGHGTIRTVFSEATQPISNALYAKHGMYQWVPLLHLEGQIVNDLRAPRSVPRGFTAEVVHAESRALAAFDAIDTTVLGVTREVDHRLWLSQPDLMGLLFTQHDRIVGYAYVSINGGIGPVAIQNSSVMPAVLAQSIRQATELDAKHLSLVVPGLCRSGLAYLLDNGFRYGESMNVVLTSRPFGHLDRYLVSAGDALL
jgi:GNAT superfamily N-acetyltransferase